MAPAASVFSQDGSTAPPEAEQQVRQQEGRQAQIQRREEDTDAESWSRAAARCVRCHADVGVMPMMAVTLTVAGSP